jgi:phospholipase D1/2
MEAGPYYERISALLEDAQHYAIFVGWQIDSRLPLRRPPEFTIESLKHKILRLVEEKPDFHFYFLMWDHAYFYILERETWQGRVWDEIHPRVHFIFDNRHAFGGSHHEKVCIIDGKVALCGGIDLCDERWDTPQHLFYDRRRSLEWKSERHGPYHDVAVQVTGPVCAQIQEHVRSRWEAISSIPFPETPRFFQPTRNAHGVYISRTLVDVDAGSTKPVTREIEFLFRDLIQLAERRIILEGQYYWSKEINNLLIAKMRAKMPENTQATQKSNAPFEIILILADIQQLRALTQQMSFYELKLLEKLDQTARETGCKLLLGCPYVFPTVEDTAFDREARPKPVYIHSKVIIVDDRFISIGSANLATRALRLDTEINLTLEAKTEFERHHIRRFSENLLSHWNIGRPQVHDHDDVKFVPLRPTHELERRMKRLNPLQRLLQNIVPWKTLFDPSQPWLHPVARKARRIARNHPGWEKWLIMLLWGGTAALTTALASIPHPNWWAYAYAAALSSVWFAPVPFVALSILSGFHLGVATGMELSIFSFWISALVGYCLSRLFPTYATRFFRETAPRWLPARLRLRRFPATVSVTADFRISLRSKIAYQGLYCIPFAWFLLNMMLVLPAALYMLLRVVFALVHPATSDKIHFYAPAIFTILLTYALARLVVSYFGVKSAATKKGLSRRTFP